MNILFLDLETTRTKFDDQFKPIIFINSSIYAFKILKGHTEKEIRTLQQ